ncbi:MAG: hypothetical protein OEU92_02245, partial [Alphaproteobacteria bacterium]|nr:hypothetical protein [Alphaproteobacteria bacterium]
DQVVSLEQRYDIRLEIKVSDELIAGHFEIETVAAPVEEAEEEPAEPKRKPAPRARRQSEGTDDDRAGAEAAEGEEDGQRKRRRRRRRRRRSGEGEEASASSTSSDVSEQPSSQPSAATAEGDASDGVEAGEGVQTDEAAAAEEGDRSGRRRRRSSSRGRRRSGSSRAASTSQPAVGTNGAARQHGGTPSSAPDIGPQPAAIMPLMDDSQPEASASAERSSLPPELAGLAEPTLSSAMMAETSAPREAPREAPQEADVTVTAQERPTPDHGQSDPARDIAADSDADMQQAAMVSEPAEPRRGWWNRFVRKTD